MTFSVTDQTPSSYEGSPYGATGMLFKIEQTWDRATNEWAETPGIIDDITTDPSLSIEFAVKTQTGPPSLSGTTVYNMFDTLVALIWDAIRALFDWLIP